MSDVVLFALGAVLVVGTLADAFNTLIVSRLQAARWWPAEVLYRLSWPAWRRLSRLTRTEPGKEHFLALYAPFSLLTLLVMWVGAEIVGWSLIWTALGDGVQPHGGWADGLYYSGVAYFTIGFGDILATTTAARVLTLLEAFMGLGTLALVIGYLPALYAAYSQREVQLLMLDDASEERIMPIALIEHLVRPDDLTPLRQFFSDWERWIAQVLESHTTYPMLMYFRSQHPGQHWITALGVVADASVIAMSLPGGPPEAERCYRRASRAFSVLGKRMGLEPVHRETITRHMFVAGYDRLFAAGFERGGFDETWEFVQRQRHVYVDWMEAFIDHLDAPRGFWGHTVETPHEPVPAAPSPCDAAEAAKWDKAISELRAPRGG